MSDVQRLLAEYVAEHQSGADADPIRYLDRVGDERERSVLADEIDRYLMSAPRRNFDAVAFAESSSARIVDALERSLGGRSGLWPALLPQFRARAGIKRSVLVERLAAALGVAERSAKVGLYYHRMEQGLLPSAGVSDRVLRAIAEILGESLESLRDAGATIAAPGGGTSGARAVFARTAGWSDATADHTDGSGQVEDEWDEVDQLFCANERQG